MKNHDLEVLFLRFRDGGDMLALAKVFDHAAPQLMPVAAHLAARRDEADDLIQATFLTAIERANSYERDRPVLPWLLGILALHARKLREKQGRLLDLERVHQREESGPEQLAAAGEVRQAVDAAVRELPIAYAGIVRRHLVEGLEPRELASELGVSSGAARVRLHRGLKLLRRALPAAFSTGGYAATTSRGIDSIREAVMERASLLTGSPIPAAGFAPWGVLLAFIAPLILALPAWMVWRTHGATEPMEAALTMAPESIATEVAPTSAAESIEALARVEAESSANNESSPTPPSAMLGDAIVRGRVLLPDGSPAVGASVSFTGAVASEARTHQVGLPTNWSDPQPQVADADGRFEFSFDPPLAYQFFLKIDQAATARAAWHWFTLLPGSRLDLGDVALEPAATIVARIVDANSNSLCSGWTLRADVPAPTTGQGRQPTWCHAKCAEASSEIVLTRVPARRVKLEAEADSGAQAEPTIVDLVANEIRHVELRYTGPDLSRRITVMTSTSPFFMFDESLFHVSASNGSTTALDATFNQEGLSAHVIDGCEPGFYDVTVSDPRFVTWTKTNVQPGEIVQAKLVGNASLRMHPTNADGTPYLGRYALRGKFLAESPSSPRSPNEFVLVKPGVDPPAGNLISGVIPASFALTLEISGEPAQNIAVLALAPNEVRDVTCSLETGLTLRGRVLASNGSTPLCAVDVQLTRGDRAGHTLAADTFFSTLSGEVPRVDQRVATDEHGEFSFGGLTAERWTLRASWGKYLRVDQTLSLDAESQAIVLQQPAHGFLMGRLLFPSGAPIDDAQLQLRFASHDQDQPPMGSGRAGTELQSDGSFDFGALPVGPVRMELLVSTVVLTGEGMESSASTVGPVHTIEIQDGETTATIMDVRSTFPGRLRERVMIDDLLASEGSVIWSAEGAAPPRQGSLKVSLDGIVLLGSLPPGAVSITFVSKDKTWAWFVPQTIAIAPGQEVAQELQLHTTPRDLRCVDVSGGAVLANVEIEWRTGLGGKELSAKARTDAAGLLHLRMPDQNVEIRCVGDSGAFTTIAWCAGNGPLTVALRRAP